MLYRRSGRLVWTSVATLPHLISTGTEFETVFFFLGGLHNYSLTSSSVSDFDRIRVVNNQFGVVSDQCTPEASSGNLGLVVFGVFQRKPWNEDFSANANKQRFPRFHSGAGFRPSTASPLSPPRSRSARPRGTRRSNPSSRRAARGARTGARTVGAGGSLEVVGVANCALGLKL